MTQAGASAPSTIVLYVHGIGGMAPAEDKKAVATAVTRKAQRHALGLALAQRLKWQDTEYLESEWGAATPVLDLRRKTLAQLRGAPLAPPAALGEAEEREPSDFPQDYSELAAADLLETVAEEPWLLTALGWAPASAATLAASMDSPYADALKIIASEGAPTVDVAPGSELAHLGSQLSAMAKFAEGGPTRAHDLENVWRFTFGSRGAGKIFNVAARRVLHRVSQARVADLLRYASSSGEDPTAPFLIVCNEILAAAEILRGGPPESRRLVLIGHSLGGVLLYDVLTAAQDKVLATAPEPLRQLARLREEIKDLHVTLVTAGSQVALFESLAALKGLAFVETPRNEFLDQPALADRWINVYDPKDVLGFGIGSDSIDRTYETNRLYAHSSYFGERRFSKWLGDQLAT